MPPTKISSESPTKRSTEAPHEPSASPTKRSIATRKSTPTKKSTSSPKQKVAPKKSPDQPDRKSGKSVVAYIIADMPYSRAERDELDAYIHRMNRRYSADGARFLIHLGDITGSKTCPESVYEAVDSILSKSKLPVLITPGGTFNTILIETNDNYIRLIFFIISFMC
jgi:hypothetical protein